MTDCVLAHHRLNRWMISDYDGWSTAGIILHIIIRASTNAASIALNTSRDTLYFYTCNCIRVTHRNGAIKHIFTNQIHGGSSADYSLFILSLHALALHLAVKILLQIFLYEDLSTLALHTSVGCISLQNASRTALCYATNTIIKHFLIFDINHQQNTRRSDQIETIKIMQT